MKSSSFDRMDLSFLEPEFSTRFSAKMSRRLSLDAVDDHSIIAMPNMKSCHAAIYEYTQFGYPETIWECGSSLFEHDEFKQFVITSPVSSNSFDFYGEPVVILSTYERIHYVAVYTEILDIQARGFSRAIVFVIANISSDLINNIHYIYYDKILELIYLLRKKPEIDFKHDLREFAGSLLKLINADNEQNRQQLESKYSELKSILERFSIDPIKAEESKNRDIDYFIQIRHKLRDIRNLINFNELEMVFDHFIEDIDMMPYKGNLSSHATYQETRPNINFGGIGTELTYPEAVNTIFINNYDNLNDYDSDGSEEFFSLRDFVKKNVFDFCVYSLLAGHPLVIISNNLEAAARLGERFTIFCPFFKKSDFCVRNQIGISDCIKYGVVVTQDLIEDADKELICVLDLDKQIYCGDSCPSNSIVKRELGKIAEKSESLFILHQLLSLKKIGNLLMNVLAEFSMEKIRGREKLLLVLKGNGFAREDEPIVRYIIYAYFNKTNCRTIIPNNMSIFGYAYLPF